MKLPDICKAPPKTRRGAERQYKAILRAYCRQYAITGNIKVDVPRMIAREPRAYERLHEMGRLMYSTELPA